MLAKHEDESDLLWGVPAIAREIGRNPRMTYWLLRRKLIPGRKVGALWVASREKLRAFLRDQEGKQMTLTYNMTVAGIAVAMLKHSRLCPRRSLRGRAA
jgi:hypothetical protein